MANTYFYTSSGEVFQLLVAVAATGAGTNVWAGSKESGGFQQKYTWSTVITGAPATLVVNLEGSLDGDNWYVLDSSSNVSGEMKSVVNTPVLYIRGNLTTLTGGTSPTLTVNLVAVAP